MKNIDVIDGIEQANKDIVELDGKIKSNTNSINSVSTSLTTTNTNVSNLNNSIASTNTNLANNYKKVWVGTQAQYDAISNKDNGTLYCVRK